MELVLECGGRDGSLAYRSVGHSTEANEMLRDYLIGKLPENERLWNKITNPLKT